MKKQGVYVIDGFVVDAYIYRSVVQPEWREFIDNKPQIVKMGNVDKLSTIPVRKYAVYKFTGRKVDGLYEYKFKGVVYE